MLDIDRARAEARLPDLVGGDVKLTKDGDGHKGLCPFHNEKTSSFSLFRGKDGVERFYCFGCGAKGDALDYIMETRGVSIHDAVQMILGDAEDTGNRRERKDAPPPYDAYADVKPLDHMPSLMPVPGERIKVWNPKREKHSTYTPEAVYKYQCGIVLRVVIEGKKLTPMLMWCEVDGVAQWSHYAFPRPRPAYGRELVTDEGQIVIVEGEKTADAARTYLNMSVVTYAGGTNGLQFTDWSFAKGRDVIVIPDADQPGRDAAEQLCVILADNGAQSVRVVDTTEMEALKKGWDLADALVDGWDKSKVVAFIKKFLTDWSRPQSREVEAAVEATLPVEVNNDWRVEILTNADGEPRAKSSYNYMQFLRHHEDFINIFRFNEFSLGITMVCCPPWEDPDSFAPKDVDDEDITFCQGWLERFGLSPTYDATRKAILATASKHKFHPARDYFETLRGKWDGVKRLDTWLVDYVGAKPTRFAQLAGRKWMVAAVRRTYEPGVKFDSMLVLEGPQGEGKSTILAELARFGGESYFTDDFPEISRDTIMNCMGTLIVEIAEMDGFSRADVTKIKSFITRQEDRIRLPYAATILKAKRQFVMAGTINPNNGYLRDPTGGRRFWPVWCDGVDVPGVKLAREQLWAEAVQLHLDGEAIYMKDGEVALAQAEQSDRYQEDVWADIIDSYIRGLREVTVIDILKHMEIPAERMDLLKEKRVSAHLEHRRWLRAKRPADGATTSGWLYTAPAGHGPERKYEYGDDFPDLDQMGEDDGA
jgi:predicted P-loop ATPase/5S rRNA maturation endonuclease (ribonuclease M5)